MQDISLQNILFIDIETVPLYSTYDEMPEALKILWDKKCNSFREPKDPVENYPRAGIYAEFGKIICIGCGYFDEMNNLRLLSFHGHDERTILKQFAEFAGKNFSRPKHYLCAHNGKEFDFPFLCRRYLVNGLSLPSILNLSGKKPWEVPHLDTLELWKFGDYKAYTSLSLLAAIFGISSPKEDMDGSMVWKVYWEENDLLRIVKYCLKDVECLIEVFLRISSSTIAETKSEMILG
ncbi:MAG: 3'-5' exonuclease [Bacteroidetes bacterium]|nr:3'-5' exonuclease [Bacteroidota bacterium]